MPAPGEQPYPQDDDGFVEEAFAQCSIPVAIYDPALRIVRASRGMTRGSGLAAAEIRGRHGVEMLLGPAGVRAELCMRQVFDTGESAQLTVEADDGVEGGQQVVHRAVAASGARRAG